MPEPRLAVQKMRPYVPPTGGRLDSLRLDFNENTVGCSPRVTEFLKGVVSSELLATYPDYEAVRQKLTGFFEVSDDQMALTNGTDEAIQILVNTYVDPGDRVVILTPSYAMYRFYAEVAGAEIVEIPYRQDTLEFDVEAVLAALTQDTKAVLISNPNNPTGAAASVDELERILAAAPQACVLVDEAYYEFHGETMLDAIGRFPNLFVSRTFSKAYGMAALRVGCLFSQAENIASIGKAQSPYSVNMLAAMAAAEAVEDQAFTRDYVAAAVAGRGSIERALDDLGIRRWPSRGNFVLFDAGERADECIERCRIEGVLIRDRRHEVPGALRVTSGPPDQVQRFIGILEELWK